MKRSEQLARWREMVASGIPLVGAGAGTGLSAKFAQRGGADLLVVYNSGRYRMAGRGSLAGMLPFGDANGIVLEMAGEILPVVDIPVFAGVCGTDPFRSMPHLLDQLAELGYTGIQNFPTVGLFDGVFRQNLEETDFGYGKEVELVRLARERDLLTSPYVFRPEEAVSMAEAGADIIVCHLGLTSNGSIGAKTVLTLDDGAERIQAMRDAAVSVNPGVIVICHGGPIAEPEDAQYILDRTSGIAGFYGASSMERLPVEKAIAEQAARFKSMTFRTGEYA